VRVAALYDVHANLPALDAVLAELAEVGPDLIVFGGDVAAGPLPRETILRLRTVDRARFVRGNCDREMVAGAADPFVAWPGAQLDDDARDFLASFELSAVVDDVLYCHATPHDDTPFVTMLTPDDVAAELIGETRQSTVVVGHSHSQFDRRLGTLRLVNAGSVGMPCEDGPGAYWALVRDGEPELRRTAYDLEAAADRLRPSRWPLAERWIAENLLTVPSAREHAAVLESQR
jgi:putative phosphoesterase